MDIHNIRQMLKTKTIYDIPMRVTFYARVSSESDEQLNSLGNQIQYYESLIRKNTNWTYVEGYIDEGLSAATTKKRESFHRMVEDGKAATLPSSFYVNCHDGYYEPRTAIGQIGPLHYIVIVVDGRREGYSTGASIPQLQQLFLDEGAEFAFNLDGGGSTTLYFRGEVINMPSGGKERSVSDIIMFTN